MNGCEAAIIEIPKVDFARFAAGTTVRRSLVESNGGIGSATWNLREFSREAELEFAGDGAIARFDASLNCGLFFNGIGPFTESDLGKVEVDPLGCSSCTDRRQPVVGE